MHYKAPDNSLHFIDPEFAYLLPTGCVQITEQEAEAIRDANKPIQPVPQSVTMRQARLALLQAGKLQAVNNAIASMTGPQGESARIEWDYSNEVKRDQLLTISLAQSIGMTESEMDALFIEAAKL